MFTTRRSHPLQTFRFWFFITGAVAVTLAWRFDLLPFRFGKPATGARGIESFTEVQLSSSSDWDEPIRYADDYAAPPSDAPFFAPDESPLSGRLTSTSSEPERGLAELPPPSQQEPLFEQNDSRSWSHPLAAEPSPSSAPEAEGSHTENARVVQVAGVSGPYASREASPVDTADQSAFSPAIDFTEIDRLIQSNSTDDHIEVHRSLSEMYWQQPASRSELRKRIDILAQRIYFLPQPHYMPAYEVQPGDMLQEIAKQYDVTWQYLAKLNRVEPQRVRAGQRIKVIKGPFSAIIDLSEFELTVHAHGYFVTRYQVGVGKDGSTPIGTFTVENKQVDPTYYGPDGVIEHDDPSNPLGERWIDIGNSYGIHGTIDPGSIGRCESRGCIRMHNDDVAAVYDLLTIGSEVTIRE